MDHPVEEYLLEASQQLSPFRLAALSRRRSGQDRHNPVHPVILSKTVLQALSNRKNLKDVVNDFVDSPETEEQLSLFLLIAIAGWNVSLHPEKDRAKFIGTFVERFNCPTFSHKGKPIDTTQKILELCDRKQNMYPELKFLVRELDVEDCRDGLKYFVISREVRLGMA